MKQPLQDPPGYERLRDDPDCRAFNQMSREDDWEGALEHARRFCERYPQRPWGYFMVGDCYRGLGRLEEAMAAYRKALEVRDEYASPEIHRWDERGRAARDRGDFAEAVAACSASLVIVLESADAAAGAWLGIGKVRWSQGRFEESVEACEKCLSLKEGDPDGWMNLGMAHQGAKRHDAAVWAYKNAIKHFGDDREQVGSVWALVGQAETEGGNPKRALVACRHAARMRPDNFHAHLFLGQACRALVLQPEEGGGGWSPPDPAAESQRRALLAECCEAMERAAALDGSTAAIWFMLGSAYGMASRWDEAVDALRRSNQIEESPGTYSLLGRTLEHAGRFDEAGEAFRREEELRSSFEKGPRGRQA
ncbi:MAG: tetratricopeptide repeat protein [Phycisphaerae bacterium]|nr:tetratricopeptide repeat protein [Phycisphaerae bacterium]